MLPRKKRDDFPEIEIATLDRVLDLVMSEPQVRKEGVLKIFTTHI
jgi:hypothetical protein